MKLGFVLMRCGETKPPCTQLSQAFVKLRDLSSFNSRSSRTFKFHFLPKNMFKISMDPNMPIPHHTLQYQCPPGCTSRGDAEADPMTQENIPCSVKFQKSSGQTGHSIRSAPTHSSYILAKSLDVAIQQHWWSSGRIQTFQNTAVSSIPRQCSVRVGQSIFGVIFYQGWGAAASHPHHLQPENCRDCHPASLVAQRQETTMLQYNPVFNSQAVHRMFDKRVSGKSSRCPVDII